MQAYHTTSHHTTSTFILLWTLELDIHFVFFSLSLNLSFYIWIIIVIIINDIEPMTSTRMGTHTHQKTCDWCKKEVSVSECARALDHLNYVIARRLYFILQLFNILVHFIVFFACLSLSKNMCSLVCLIIIHLNME